MSNAPDGDDDDRAGGHDPAVGHLDDAGPGDQPETDDLGPGRPSPAFVPIAGGLAALLLITRTIR